MFYTRCIPWTLTYSGKNLRREHTELSIQHQQLVENYIMLINSPDEETTNNIGFPQHQFELSAERIPCFRCSYEILARTGSKTLHFQFQAEYC